MGGETSLAAWLGTSDPAEQDDEHADKPNGRVRLTALVALPWVLVAILGARVLGAGAQAPAAAPQVPASPAATAPPAVPTPVAPAPAAGDPGVRQAVKVALTDVRDGSGRIADDAVVEALEAVGQVAVARVRAVVVDVADGQMTGVRLARFAVPLHVSGTAAAPAGAPWALPPDPLPPAPAWRDDPDAALATETLLALQQAGYAGAEVSTVARSETVPEILAVTARAVAPGDAQRLRHVVWLHAGPPLRVLGTPAPAPREAAS